MFLTLVRDNAGVSLLFFPGRMRIYLKIIFFASFIIMPFPLIHIPSPGAVCPATVKFPLFIIMGSFKLIIPEISKIITLSFGCSRAYLKEPSLFISSSVVT